MLQRIKSLYALPFVQNVVHTLGTKGIIIIAGFFSTVMVSRSLGTGGRGAYSIVITSVGVLIQLGNLGVHVSNVFYGSSRPRIVKYLHANSLLLTGIIGFLLAIGFVATYQIRGKMFELTGIEVLLAAILIPIQLGALFFKNLSVGIGKIKEANKIEVTVKLGLLLLMYGLFVTNRLEVIEVILIVMVESLFGFLFNYRIVRRTLDSKPTISLRILKHNFYFGFRAYLVAFFSYTVIRSDIFLVERFLGKDQVGIYSQAVFLVDNLGIIAPISASILLPKLASITTSEEKYLLNQRVLKIVSVIMLAISCAFFVFATPFMQIFGKAFIPAVPSFKILLIANLFLSIETIMAQYMAATGMPIRLIYYWIVAFFVNVLCNLFLIPRFGIEGSAYSSVIAYFAITCLVWTDNFRNRPKQLSNNLQ